MVSLARAVLSLTVDPIGLGLNGDRTSPIHEL